MTEFEELPQPGPDGRQRRLRIDIAVGALGLLLVVLVIRATTHHHNKPGAASNTATTAPASPIGGFGTPPDSGSGLLNGMATGGNLGRSLPTSPDDDPTICPPSHPACSRTEYLPPAVVTAIRAAFPTARVQSCYTLRLTGRPDGLHWFRQISASFRGAPLVIQLQAPPPTGNPVPNGRSGTTTFYSAEPGGYFVSIEFGWPGRATSQLAQLATDRRLLAD
jgi:hypothetical protein